MFTASLDESAINATCGGWNRAQHNQSAPWASRGRDGVLVRRLSPWRVQDEPGHGAVGRYSRASARGPSTLRSWIAQPWG
jgi:hypothetical protein